MSYTGEQIGTSMYQKHNKPLSPFRYQNRTRIKQTKTKVGEYTSNRNNPSTCVPITHNLPQKMYHFLCQSNRPDTKDKFPYTGSGRFLKNPWDDIVDIVFSPVSQQSLQQNTATKSHVRLIVAPASQLQFHCSNIKSIYIDL